MKNIFIRLVRGYQKHLSPLKGRPTCRFYPTCSEYAVLAVEKYGFAKGFLKAVWRILRCNPFNPGGIDFP